ncbi:MerR family transcriptional regulator [Bacteriovorax sp. DB6_IX]|uniref:MerR family transcriptional regulator n=1 Tax=Bacteriovorax sp. DB6_IX TaxID=1353530 RepID=UPI00038A41E4|nr:MerR family transcriptional regulator [Bacteriovorax sp. DB6_IX]EQC51243.1 MerR HTH family regulatory protein [Bacteriovorax sp. DB6_IX]
MDKKLSIKVISNACGVLPHTIRTWERRYQTFSPERSASGQRLYSQDDLARARLIVLLIGHGFSISQISDHSLEDLKEAVSDLVQEIDESSFMIKRGCQNLFEFIENYSVENIAKEIEYLRLSLGARDFIFHVILPVMREIGILVSKGKYSVSQEHIISSIMRAQLALLNLPNLGNEDQSVILATPEGNLHELSILIADVLCRIHRTSTVYLGASHPADCLTKALNALKAKTVVLGVLSSDKWDFEKKITGYLKEMDQLLDHEITLVLGGVSKTSKSTVVDLPKYKKIKSIHYLNNFEEFEEFLIERVR